MKSGATLVRQTSFEFEQQMSQENLSKLETMMATLFPELYVLYENVKLFRIPIDSLPILFSAIADIAETSKLGEVIVEIRPSRDGQMAEIRRIRIQKDAGGRTIELGLPIEKT